MKNMKLKVGYGEQELLQRVAIEPKVAFEKGGSESRTEANSKGSETHEVAFIDELKDVLMEEESCKGD
ncbi:hypothetical protein Bca52824_021565 [Brassica carinata]|uniref:Uncharacterized protein n=1 Tax=Brassica carinata TaxID=52824 RepID=A0A8X7VEK8_BRACI|nr:hypothetical protein Bca52824_021565 [Brassica carinata]